MNVLTSGSTLTTVWHRPVRGLFVDDVDLKLKVSPAVYLDPPGEIPEPGPVG